MRRLYRAAWGDVATVDRLSRGIVAALFVAALVIITVSLTGDETRSDVVSPAAVREQADAIPPCQDVEITDEARACRTATKTLYIGPEDVPILLESMDVRVLSAKATPERLAIRIRLRNQTDESQNTGEGPREVYVNVAGRQIFARPRPSVEIAPGDAENVRFGFPLDAADIRAIRRAQGRIELAVAPFGAGGAGRSDTLAVARLRVPVGDLVADPAQSDVPATTPPAETAPAAPPG